MGNHTFTLESLLNQKEEIVARDPPAFYIKIIWYHRIPHIIFALFLFLFHTLVLKSLWFYQVWFLFQMDIYKVGSLNNNSKQVNFEIVIPKSLFHDFWITSNLGATFEFPWHRVFIVTVSNNHWEAGTLLLANFLACRNVK